MDVQTPTKFIRLPQVMERTSLTRTQLYKLRNDDPTFPKSVPIGPRNIAFVEAEVEAWQQSRIAERDQVAA